jgi:hypothetical protein
MNFPFLPWFHVWQKCLQVIENCTHIAIGYLT